MNRAMTAQICHLSIALDICGHGLLHQMNEEERLHTAPLASFNSERRPASVVGLGSGAVSVPPPFTEIYNAPEFSP